MESACRNFEPRNLNMVFGILVFPYDRFLLKSLERNSCFRVFHVAFFSTYFFDAGSEKTLGLRVVMCSFLVLRRLERINHIEQFGSELETRKGKRAYYFYMSGKGNSPKLKNNTECDELNEMREGNKTYLRGHREGHDKKP